MGKLFGTDGVRGEANRILTPSLAYQLGRAAAYVLKHQEGRENKENAFIIGKDTRISGDMLEASLISGICSTGVNVYCAGVIPTPAVAVLTREVNALAGVVISASHNPFGDNGIKFFNPNGQKLSDEQELEIEQYIEKDLEGIPYPVGDQLGRVLPYHQGQRVYSQFIKKHVQGDFSGLKVVVDCANGAASAIAPQLLTDLGAEVIAIHHEPNGININDHCGSTHLADLQKKVVQEQVHLGIAYDGDADRLLAVDHLGNVIDGDRLLVIFALYLSAGKQLNRQKMVATVMSNMGLKEALKMADIEVIESKVGDRYVIEEMEKHGAVLGGEQSGHIIFRNYNTTGDGILSSVKLLEIIKQSGRTLNDLGALMTQYPQVLINVPVKSKANWEREITITLTIKKLQEKLGDQGRILVRASGTENLLRVMVEGKDQAYIEAVAKQIAGAIDETLNQ